MRNSVNSISYEDIGNGELEVLAASGQRLTENMSDIFDIHSLAVSISSMSTIHELGEALRARRAEMGLSQAQVAALTGLSRQTVNQLETGTVPDLGLNKAERLASALGLGLRVERGLATAKLRRTMSPLSRAATTAGVSYKNPISKIALKRILSSGRVPERYVPHVHAFLDDAPVSLLAAVAEQLDGESNIGRREVWKNYRSLAHEVKSKRRIWQ